MYVPRSAYSFSRSFCTVPLSSEAATLRSSATSSYRRSRIGAVPLIVIEGVTRPSGMPSRTRAMSWPEPSRPRPLPPHAEPVLLEMEAEGRERGFPIIGRLVGVTVELLARSIGARRVFELGSGFGYSAYWFARAVGPGGEVHCTDGDPRNEAKALGYLGRAGLDAPVRWHVGDAVSNPAQGDGDFDIVYVHVLQNRAP